MQAVVPSDEHPPGTTNLVLYSRPPGAFTAYLRREATVAWQDAPDALAGLATSAPDAGAPHDVLVCAHGARDRCCGGLGTALAAGFSPGPAVRVHRTSHTGGHRFAPTAVLLPEGTAWGWLDGSVLRQIVSRSGDVRDVIGHYRGCTAFAEPVVQYAERAVFGEVGWGWLDEGRAATIVDASGDTTVVRIDSTVGRWRVVLAQGWRPQPVCGAELSAATKVDPVFELIELVQETERATATT